MKCPNCEEGEMELVRGFWAEIYLKCDKCGYEDKN